MSRPVRELAATSRPAMLPLRTSALRMLLSTMSALPIRSAAYELPPSATKTAIVAITFA